MPPRRRDPFRRQVLGVYHAPQSVPADDAADLGPSSAGTSNPIPGQTRVVGGRWEAWIDNPPPGGWVCAEPVENNPEGMCGMPVESEPCPLHRGEEVP